MYDDDEMFFFMDVVKWDRSIKEIYAVFSLDSFTIAELCFPLYVLVSTLDGLDRMKPEWISGWSEQTGEVRVTICCLRGQVASLNLGLFKEPKEFVFINTNIIGCNAIQMWSELLRLARA